jgi:hypothetical protein
MPTKREYLVAKGLAKPGHGRFSVAAKEAIKIAINSGTKFDYPGNEGTGVDATPEPRWDRPQGYYTFKNPDGTTFKRKHTEACVVCSYSFQWCQCATPAQWAYNGVLGEYAKLHAYPKAVITTNDVPDKQPQQGTRRGRGRPRKS